jgi:hypothetical protein
VVERHCETQNEASFSFHHEKQKAASQQNCDFSANKQNQNTEMEMAFQNKAWYHQELNIQKTITMQVLTFRPTHLTDGNNIVMM